VVAAGRDGGADSVQGLGAECPLELLEVSLLRLLRARARLPGGVPELIEVREPLGARDGRPLAGVEPYARAGRAPVEMERMRGVHPRAHQDAAAPRTEAGELVGAGCGGLHVQRGRNDVLLDCTVRQPDAATTRAPRGRYGGR